MSVVLSRYSIYLFLVGVATGLSSCFFPSKGNHPVVTAAAATAIRSENEIPRVPGFNFEPTILRSPDSGIAVLVKHHDNDKLMLDHYSHDSMSLDWSIPIPLEQDYYFEQPICHYAGGKLYLLSHIVQVGSIWSRDNDSIGVRSVVVDPRTHTVLRDSFLTRTHTPPSFGMFGWKRMSASPDSSFVLISYWANHKEFSDGIAPLPIATVSLYTVTGTLIGTREIPINVPKDISAYQVSRWLQRPQVDNAGNVYLIRYAAPDSIVATQWDFRNGSSRTLATTFRDLDMMNDKKIGRYQTRIERNGLLTLVAAREDDDDATGMLYASFDFNSNAVDTHEYHPSPATLDSMLDQKTLNNYQLANIMRLNAGPVKTLLVFEKRESGSTRHDITMPGANAGGRGAEQGMTHVVGSVSIPYDIAYGLLACAYDANWNLLWQRTIPKKQDDEIHYFTRAKGTSGLEIFYTDETPAEGLESCTLDLASGAVSQPTNVLQFESDTYLETRSTIWDGNDAILFARGSSRGLWPYRSILRVAF